MLESLRSDDREPNRRASRTAIILLLLVWIGFNGPAFLGRVLFPVDLDGSVAEAGSPTGKISNPLDSDAYTLYYPLRVYLGERLRSGDLPLWDPHRFAGTPFAANSQAAAWYPPNWAFAVGDPLLTYSWLLVLTRLAGLLAAYWFFRVLSLHPLAAAGGAIVFVGSGFMMAWGTHITFPSSAIWLPLALGGITRVFQGRARSGVPTASVALGMAILGGHPQVTIFVWLAAALWTVVWGVAIVLERRTSGLSRSIREALPRLSLVVLPFLLGVGLGSMQLLASLDFSQDVVRGAEPEPYEGLVSAALPFRHLLTLVLPDRFGNPLDGNTVGPINYTEGAMYAGILALVPVAIGVWRRPDRVTLAFLTLGAVGGLAAFGTPLFRVLYLVVPGLSRLRSVGRFVFLVDVALAGLAAVGLDRMLSRERQRRLVLLGGGLVLGTLIASVISIKPISWSYLLPRLLLAGSLLVVGLGFLLWLGRTGVPRLSLGVGVVLLLAADLWAFGFRYHPFQDARPIYSETPLVQRLRASSRIRPRIARLFHYWIPVNGALPHQLYDVQGYDNFIPSRYVDLVSLIEDQEVNAGGFNVIYNFTNPARLESPIADLLGIRFVVAASDQVGLGSPQFTNGVSVFTRPHPMRPAFLVHCWAIVPGDSAVDRLRTMDLGELRTIGIVDRETSPSSPLPNSNCAQGQRVGIENYEPETATLAVETDRSALLVMSDNWDQGWEATIDGVSAPVARVNHAMRGVFLEPGKHRVQFRYRPDWLAPALLVTGFSVVVLTALVLIAVWRRQRSLTLPTRYDGNAED